MKPIITFVDADSIACAAGDNEDPSQVRYVVDGYINRIKKATQCNDVRGFVERWGWKQNFRKHVAVTQPYKAGRSPKPEWTDDAKRYLVDAYGFGVATYIEAEDAVACAMHEVGIDKCYGAAIDKDVVKGVPGTWYNYKKQEWVVTSVEDAARFEYCQIVTGDPGTDNIPGIVGVAEKTAAPLFTDAPIDELPHIAAHAYKYADTVFKRVQKPESYAYFLEQARLIHIRRAWDEPPFTPITKEQWEAL